MLRRTVLTLCAAAGLVAATAAPPAFAATPAWGISAVRGAADATGYPTLQDVRWAAQDGYDRTVFEFSGGTPGYRVGYGTLRGLGSGETIPLAGAADLVVDFEFARAHDGNYRSTYPLRTRDPLLRTLRQIKWGGDYEGYVRAGLGLREIVAFRVFTLGSPARVVVDVAHNSAFRTSGTTKSGTATNATVEEVRAARHPGWDRLVFDLAGSAVPGAVVRYSGDTSLLLVKVSGTSAASYGGPSPISFGLPAVRTVRLGADTGNAVIFRVATARRAGYRLTVLTSPPRLVVDVKH